jgi:hypothetical protein
MPHLSPAHQETSKPVSPHNTNNRVEQLKHSGFKFKPRSQLLITNKTKVLTTCFFILPLVEYIDNTKAQSLNFESKTHEAQLEHQKPKKSLRRSSTRRKTRKATNGTKSSKPGKKQRKDQTQVPLKQTPPNTLNACSSS